MRRFEEDLLSFLFRISSRIFVLILTYFLMNRSIEALENIYTTYYMKGLHGILKIFIEDPGIMIMLLVAPFYILLIIFMKPVFSFTASILMILSGKYSLDQIMTSLITFVYTLYYDMFATVYRDGEIRYIKIVDKNRMSKIIGSLIIIITTFVAPIYFSIEYIYIFINTLKGSVRPLNIYEAPLINFITQNPLGITILILSLLVVFSYVIINIVSIFSIYISRVSKDLLKNFFRDIDDIDVSFDYPMRSLRDIMFSILFSPFIYAILIRLFDYLSKIFVSQPWIKDFLSVFISFILSWVMIKAILSIISSKETDLKRIIIAILIIILIYSSAYLSWGWDPRSGILNLRPIDQFIYENMYRYYLLIYYYIELIGRVMGLVP
ncbi:MAG: hypothetical protein GU359_05125 [Desulfurococcales archaeon]|jgi:hypothetical protein|nr:hypothetical protein [Desulfurococcales archaeon]